MTGSTALRASKFYRSYAIWQKERERERERERESQKKREKEKGDKKRRCTIPRSVGTSNIEFFLRFLS